MKIVILGTCGSGKTTLAKELSKRFSIPHIELDSLYWGPNWVPVAQEEFDKKVREVITQDGWVVDGNNSRMGKELIWPSADVAIWLDYPLYLILWRLIKRVTRRAFTRETLWNGCQETLRRQFFSRESIFAWTFRSYWKRKRIYPFILPKFPNLEFIRVTHPKYLRSCLENNRRLKLADTPYAENRREETEQ